MSNENTGSSNEEIIQANDQKLKQYADELSQLQSDIESNNALSIKHGKMTLEFALKAGAILLNAKKIAPYGDWGTWLKENVKAISQRTAENYMKLAEKAAETKHVAFFEAAEGLREAYLEFGIVQRKPKSKTNPKETKGEATPDQKPTDGELTPEQMKEKDKAQYDAKWNVARQSARSHVRETIETAKELNWDLSTWTVKNNKPCSGDDANQASALFHSLKQWVGRREFSSLTYEDEVTTKAGIVLTAVVTTIILANTKAQTQIAPQTTLMDLAHVSVEINPEPVADAELATA